MIRSLWVLVKISIVVGIVIWVAERPGTITIDWMQYKFTAHVGFFLLVMLGVVVLGILIFAAVKTLVDMPKTMARYRDITHKDKGMKALAIGLAAVAAGDAKGASYQADRAKRFLRRGDSLALLLSAQSARLDGREVDAAQGFIALLEDKDASFLGVRGLLQSALDCGDYGGALELGYRALKSNPKQGWILCLVYDLEVRAANWGEARKVLYRAEKAGAIKFDKANSDRIAMYLAQSDNAKAAGDEDLQSLSLNKASKIDAGFVPMVARLARMYMAKDKHRYAVSAIENAWKQHPHPDLVKLWGEAYSASVLKNNDTNIDTMARVRWFEKLVSLNPNSACGLLALAGALVSEGLWGEARKNLELAQEIEPSAELYQLWARLEEKATHDDMAVRKYLEMAENATPSKVWICADTGRVYNEWMPISDQGLFNTIIWDLPQGRVIADKLSYKPMLIGRN